MSPLLRSLSPMARMLVGFCLVVQAGALPAGDIALFQRYIAQNACIDQAGRAVQERRFGEASRLLETCLQKVPDHFEAHYLLARMAYEGRDYTGTLAHLDISLRALADLDRCYREELADLKAQDEAEELIMRSGLDNLAARGVDPTGCSGFLYRVKRSAIEFLESKKGHLYQSENPFALPADYLFLRGNALYRLGRREEARAQFRQAVATDPTHANAWNNLLALHLEAKDPVQARADLQRAEAARIAVRPELRQAILATP
ncbi:MAG: tetratricopeptide repeat protein [Geothrix sp.]|uniref:tetratricopeptide repeat protein n=1 Tax=Geothrix sp. TaxID=1962974 RepID=UPI00184AFF06|nr:tetratricopeptide repeat protein [Geothrix sp.]NWJ42573.1 tetratricopeptide repeat protein [Geothrix sp.]WIL19467.1 MAG: tetratricopeptide repeat protein [Geothrix sp.]